MNFRMVLTALLTCALYAGCCTAFIAAGFLTRGPVVVPACHCGCMETGQCKCKNCCERTADPTWKEAK